MKFVSSQLSYFFQSRDTKRNILILLKFLFVLLFLITLFSVVFHYIMAYEGREASWVSGLYWTLTVMTTLGFGDITFVSDLGRIFSVIVLLTGVLLLLVMLPFTFIQFFYAPWIEAERKSRTPRELPENTRDHIIITGYNAVTAALIDNLVRHNRQYTILVGDTQQAYELYDMGLTTSVGHIDDPETYRLMRTHQAAMVVAPNSDEINTNIAFTVREISESVPVICTADSADSVDILTLAGASKVLQLPDMLGRSLARRTLGGTRRANVIGTYQQLIIAEAPVTKTPLAGRSLVQSRLREITGVTAVGLWHRGSFSIPEPDTTIPSSGVLVIAGSKEQIRSYEQLMCIYQSSPHPVILIGGGRVGRAVASALTKRNIKYTIIDKESDPLTGHNTTIQGNAADIAVLKRAGIDKAPTAILTTHDDATNIYLAKYCRSLRPDIQIICRANVDRNVSTLHRAGADFVMSFASLGSNMIYNYLQSSQILMLAEGLDLFRMPVPGPLRGKSLKHSQIRQQTGCSVVALKKGKDIAINPDPDLTLTRNHELILIGTTKAEQKFFKKYSNQKLPLKNALMPF